MLLMSRRARLLALLASIAGMLSLASAPASGVAGFGDVQEADYYTEAVQWMVDNEITNGTTPTCFSPADPVSRGEAAAFMWRMEGEPAAPAHTFTDVAAPWQQGAVSWMADTEITTGVTSTTFAPDDIVTRGQLAALLYRLAGEPAGSPPHPFTDVAAPWQQAAVSWMAANGITTGTTATTFAPDDTITRAQIATFLHRYQGEPDVTVDPTHPRSPVCPQQVGVASTGFDSLFIGHSFFIPVANELPDHAARAGFVDHTQQTFFSGGATGAPEALWNNATKRATIQGMLDGGDVELFGMTYHPTYPSMDGYRLWIDYALAQNPDTIIFIGLPWSTDPGDVSAAEYASTWLAGNDAFLSSFVTGLRAEYPGVTIFEIPYGHAAVELYSRFDAGTVPDVDRLVQGGGEPGIFRDAFGHADPILLELAGLVWLRAIYDVELATYDDDPGYTTDLKAIADSIMDAHDPAFGLY